MLESTGLPPSPSNTILRGACRAGRQRPPKPPGVPFIRQPGRTAFRSLPAWPGQVRVFAPGLVVRGAAESEVEAGIDEGGHDADERELGAAGLSNGQVNTPAQLSLALGRPPRQGIRLPRIGNRVKEIRAVARDDGQAEMHGNSFDLAVQDR